MKQIKNRKGIAFLTTVILLAIIVLICAGLSVAILRDVYTVKQLRYATQAYFLAEAGIEKALKELHADFSYSAPVGSTPLGAGTYSITIDTFPGSLNRKLITSTGSVRCGIDKYVTRAINVQVRSTMPEAFNYSALGGGKMLIAGGSVISNAGDIHVHSNSPAASKSLSVGNDAGTGEVQGDVSACGQVFVHDPNGTVTGDIESGADYIDPPPFDDTFFQYYYDLANEDSNVFNGSQDFWSDPCAGTTNKVCYVSGGQARLHGTWAMTGCIVATGKIIINRLLPLGGGHITQHQATDPTSGKLLPAFMSKNSNVEIWDPTDMEGMVYAGNRVFVDSWWGTAGPTTIDGSAYGRGRVVLSAQTNLHYRMPNPPGLPSDSQTVEILSWSR